MKKNIKTNLKISLSFLFLLLVSIPTVVIGQSVINASGGSHSFSGGVFEYSIGEMTEISTERNDEIIVTQGLLQIEDVSLGVPEESFSIQNLTVYPNPTKGELHIKPSLGKSGELSLKLYDLLGRIVVNRNVYLQTGQEQQVLDLSSLSEATYMLNIEFFHGKERYLSSYKILKYGN